MVIAAEDIKAKRILSTDLVIALMGPTGSGKSNMIDTLTNQRGRRAGSSSRWEPDTTEVRAVRFSKHPNYGDRLVLVDIPGFDDTNKSDLEILQIISDWLQNVYERRIKLAGIIYLHRITDSRMGITPHRNLRMFGQLCGDQAMKKVVLATTMWDKAASEKQREIFERREKELVENYWKGMLAQGASIARFSNSAESGWQIIEAILQHPEPAVLLLQEEIVDLKRKLNETQAGQTLYSDLQKILAAQRDTVRTLAEHARNENNPQLARQFEAEIKRIQKDVDRTFKEIKNLKVPLSPRLKLCFGQKSRGGWALEDLSVGANFRSFKVIWRLSKPHDSYVSGSQSNDHEPEEIQVDSQPSAFVKDPVDLTHQLLTTDTTPLPNLPLPPLPVEIHVDSQPSTFIKDSVDLTHQLLTTDTTPLPNLPLPPLPVEIHVDSQPSAFVKDPVDLPHQLLTTDTTPLPNLPLPPLPVELHVDSQPSAFVKDPVDLTHQLLTTDTTPRLPLPNDSDVHTVQRPIQQSQVGIQKLQASVCCALTTLEAGISPWMHPSEWLDANTKHICSIFDAIADLTENEAITFPATMIFRRLILYIFAYNVLCSSDKTLLSELNATLKKYQDWDILNLMRNQGNIRNELLILFRNTSPEHSEMQFEDLLQKLLVLDSISLLANVEALITDEETYEEVVETTGPGAQSLVDLLHARLDFPMDSGHRRLFVGALTRLSQTSGLYPEALTLTNVTTERGRRATGGFADVYKGRCLSEDIALKIFKIPLPCSIDSLNSLRSFDGHFQNILREFITWRQLSHPNVLPFYGIHFLEDTLETRFCLVSPWMENGSVVDFLARRNRNDPFGDTTDCVFLALDVAHGLKYLHGEKFIHRDLKGRNILISPSMRAYIADFGLTTLTDSGFATTIPGSEFMGTPRWLAPELIPHGEAKRHHTYASDIYAFALVCYEMFSGEVPFKDVLFHNLPLMLERGDRPSFPADDLSRRRGLRPEMEDLIRDCWTQEPTKRPSANTVVERLQLLRNPQDDERPLNEIGTSFCTQLLSDEVDNPFAILGREYHQPALNQPILSNEGHAPDIVQDDS